MLTLLADYSDVFSPLNLFRYLTFRAGGATLTAFVIALTLGPWMIRRLKQYQGDGQPIRKDGPASHFASKAGTPTMGGLLILASFAPAALLWSDPREPFVWVLIAVMLTFAAIGFADDMLKLRRRSSHGLPGRLRLLAEFAIAALFGAVFLFYARDSVGTGLAIPMLKSVVLPLTLVGFLLFVGLVVAGSANAVNLTDGLDGLAVAPVMIAAGTLGLIAWLAGNATSAEYLQITHTPGTGELAALCAAIIGAGLGFLWFNAPPAAVFMGDTGSLSLGAGLGGVAVMTRHELVYAIIGGLFVMEAVSVIVQVASFRLLGRRVFRMAPFHHHLESKGLPESLIVVRLWIVAFLLALAGLATLKLR